MAIPAKSPDSSGTSLERAIRLPQAVAMVVGTIVGASIFVQPSEVTRYVPSLAGIFLVWIAAGLLTLCGALVSATLSAEFPQTGGVYVYLRQTISPAAGFLWGWAMFWSAHSGIIAAIAVVLARYAGYFASLGDRGVRAVAILAIVLLSAVNYLGIKPGSALQTALTAVKLAAILAIVALVFLHGRGAGTHAVATGLATAVSPKSFLLAIGAGLFAFGGWHMVTYTSGETENARRTIPRALIIGTLIVSGCYLALNAAYLYILPLDRILHSTRIAADAAIALVGPNGAAAITALVVISAMGSLNGIILAGPRVYFAMAQDGLWFRWMAAIHPRFRTPHLAIAAQAVWSSVLVGTGTYRVLFTRVVYTEWLFFGLMTIGLLRLRGSRLHWGSIVPLIFLTGCVLIVVNQIVADPIESATGLLMVAAGLPVYFYVHRRLS